jgi:hypothetical protein
MIEYTVRVSRHTKEWYLNGKRHREDGPAFECSSGDKQWYLNGKRHREDGPAHEYSNGEKEWWLDGEEYTKEEFLKRTRAAKELSIAEIEALLGYKIKVLDSL